MNAVYKHIIFGMIAALLINVSFINTIIPFSFIKEGLTLFSVIIHELGHTIFAWLFGHTAIPALDFKYGGGFTTSSAQQYQIIRAIVFLLLICLAFAIGHKNKVIGILIFIFALIIGIVGFFHFHLVVKSFMGHGFEALVGSALILWTLADFSYSTEAGKLEKYIPSFVGFYLNFNLIKEFYLVIHDDFHKDLYISQKDQVHIGDFSNIADWLWVDLETVCYFGIGFFIFCLILPFIVIIIWNLCSTVTYKHDVNNDSIL